MNAAVTGALAVGRGVRRLAMTLPELRSARRISGIEKLSVGMEADLWSFTVEADGRERPEGYVLKLFTRAGGEQARNEMESLEAVRAVGLECPRAVACSQDPAVFDRPFLLMERVEGPSLKEVYYDTPEDERGRVLETFCQIFAELHGADWKPSRDRLLTWEEDDPYGYLLALLPGLLGQIKRLGIPGFVPIWNWLGERLPEVPCRRPAILHGDFHPGNVLLPPDRPPVSIDWGGAMVGDPRRDIAWSLLLIGAHEAGVRDRILDEYRNRSGDELEDFEYFEVLASLIRLLLVAESWEYFLDRFRERGEAELEVTKLADHVESVRRLIRQHAGIELGEMDRILESLWETA